MITPTPADQAAVVKRLGYLPLAIMLAGPQLRETAAAQWLAEFDAYELELQRPQSEHDSLAWTFERSLRRPARSEAAAVRRPGCFSRGRVAAPRPWSGCGRGWRVE